MIELASIKDNKRTKYLSRAEGIDLGMRKVELIYSEGEREKVNCRCAKGTASHSEKYFCLSLSKYL